MEKEYIKNLKALAGVGNSCVSEQNMKILCAKYKLTETDLENMRRYCKDHNITIFDEEKDRAGIIDRTDATYKAVDDTDLGIKRKEYDKLAKLVTDRIFTIASNMARKKGHRPVFYCGRYIRLLKDRVTGSVKAYFTLEQLRLVTDRLPDSCDDELLLLQKQLGQKEYDGLNIKMIELVRTIYSELYQ